jgi:hypothetical protein
MCSYNWALNVKEVNRQRNKKIIKISTSICAHINLLGQNKYDIINKCFENVKGRVLTNNINK